MCHIHICRCVYQIVLWGKNVLEVCFRLASVLYFVDVLMWLRETIRYEHIPFIEMRMYNFIKFICVVWRMPYLHNGMYGKREFCISASQIFKWTGDELWADFDWYTRCVWWHIAMISLLVWFVFLKCHRICICVCFVPKIQMAPRIKWSVSVLLNKVHKLLYATSSDRAKFLLW